LNKILGAFGSKIDVLINNAGRLFARKTIEEVEKSFYDLVIDISSLSARDGGDGFALFITSKGKDYDKQKKLPI